MWESLDNYCFSVVNLSWLFNSCSLRSASRFRASNLHIWSAKFGSSLSLCCKSDISLYVVTLSLYSNTASFVVGESKLDHSIYGNSCSFCVLWLVISAGFSCFGAKLALAARFIVSLRPSVLCRTFIIHHPLQEFF